MTTPTIEPGSIAAGDTLAFTRELADYPASAGWVLSYALRGLAGAINFTASASGAIHAVTVAASVTATWPAGRYLWSAYVSKAGERYEVGTGQLVVRPNLAAAASLDTRGHARKVLDAIEAVLEGRATRDQEEYSIGDRSLKRTPLADLVMLRQRYRAEVNREEEAARLAAGLPSGRRVFVRFTGAS